MKNLVQSALAFGLCFFWPKNLTIFMLTVLYSNSYEVLEHALLEQLGAPVNASLLQGGNRDDFANGWANWAESVVVPHRGCRDRLEQGIARRYGICANIDFPFLASWLWAQMGTVLERSVLDPASHSVLHSASRAPQRLCAAFSTENLVWGIYRLLEPGVLEEEGIHEGMERLRGYVSSNDACSRYALACRIAALFERYLINRPDWLLAWQHRSSEMHSALAASAASALPVHPDASWQAVLWRRLCEALALEKAPSVQVQSFLEQVQAKDFSPPMHLWPARASFFILPDIAPLHLTIIRELARWIDIRLYVLNPCREYWHEIANEASSVRTALQQMAQKEDAHPVLSESYIETGNTLLAQWGRHTQRYLRKLEEGIHTASAGEASFYMEYSEPTWLAAVKNAVLDLQAYPSFSRVVEWPEAHLENGSAAPVVGIEVHSCHSLVRQLEVLHNRLLAQFAQDPSLQPADVLVVVPDIASTVPLIDAVFGTAEGARHIPYRHIGASAFCTNPVAQIFVQLLTMAEQEVTLSTLFEWLQVDAFAARFGIEPNQVDTLESWLQSAGAVCGLGQLELSDQSGKEGARRGVTFSDALMRLVLGYALPEGASPIYGWLPVIGAQKGAGSSTHFSSNAWESVHTEPEWLGALIAVSDALNDFAKDLATAHTPTRWHTLLSEGLERFFAPDPVDAAYVMALRTALHTLTQAMAQGAPDTEFSAAVLREALQVQLDAKARTEPSGGGVTFSDRTAHYGLSYRVIALIGMDAGVWPSIAGAEEFDLIAAFPRAGDAYAREEARALFLAYLLAAQDLFFIAYTGRSVRDDTALPPAVPVDTLLDYLSRAACGENATPEALEAARQRFITVHPLHPFSAAYFAVHAERASTNINTADINKDTAIALLSTYDPQQADIAAALAVPLSEKKQKPFFAATPIGLNHRPEWGHTLHFDQVLRFWSHPIRTLLRDHWAIAFPFSRVSTDEEARRDETLVVADWRARETLAEKVLPVLLDASRIKRVDTPIEAVESENAAIAKVREQAMQIAQACPGWPSGVLGDLACKQEYRLLLQYAERVLYAQSGHTLLPQQEAPPFRYTPNDSTHDVLHVSNALNFELKLVSDGLSPVLAHFLNDFLAGHPTVPALSLLTPTESSFTLKGILQNVTSQGLVLYRYARVTARDYLSAWVQHLVLCALAPDGVQHRTTWLGKDQADDFSFNTVKEASVPLVELITLYQAGCLKPLPFFLKSAFAEVTQGSQAAHQIWEGNARVPGESTDPYIRLGLRAQQEGALSPAFTALAGAIFTPLLAAMSQHTDREVDPCKR